MSRVSAQRCARYYPRHLHAHVDETAAIATLLGERQGPDHVMLDVGAQRGASAVHFARLGWTVHCFEPHPVIRHALAQRFDDRPNVHVHARALGGRNAKGVPFFESPVSSGVASLQPFSEAHLQVATVDVATVAEIVGEFGLATVDFLKIDVEGLDFQVVQSVPWDRLRPDVIECEFEDAKTVLQGHSWGEMAAYLRDQGYTVYVSEWYPVLRYGARHDWRRIVPYSDELQLRPTAWGNLLAFREDPGAAAVRRALQPDFAHEQAKPESAAPVVEPNTEPSVAQPNPKGRRRRGLIRRILRRGRRLIFGLRPTPGPSATPSGSAARQPGNRSQHGHQLLVRLLPDIAREVPAGWVVEIGSTREKLPGQGSTVVLASLAAALGLPFVTVDMDPNNTQQAREDISPFPGAHAETARGEAYLATFDQPIVAAYLDAFDIQHGQHSEDRVERYRRFLGTEITNAAASTMHLAAASALLPRLVPGGLVVIDDTWQDGAGYEGKGSEAVPMLLASGLSIVERTQSAVALRSAAPDARRRLLRRFATPASWKVRQVG